MSLKVAVIGAGAMGAGVAGRLRENGAEVVTVLDGRSAASHARARAAGVAPVTAAEALDAELILSIVPPGQAVEVARLYSGLAGAGRRPLPAFVECNAISPMTAASIAAIVTDAGMPFIDGCIIGFPPSPGTRSPILYLAGPDAGRAEPLGRFGLRVDVLDGDAYAASALKMCYGGILKGTAALGSAMTLAASRVGAAKALRAEMADSLPGILAFLDTVVPNMYSRAYRWVDEMLEVGDFVGQDRAESDAYKAIAGLYARLADGGEPTGREIDTLKAFYDEQRAT